MQQKLQKLGGAGQGHKLQLSAEAGADGNTTSTKGDQNQSQELEEILREGMLKSENLKSTDLEEGEDKRLAPREIVVLPLHTQNAVLVLKCAFYYVAVFFSTARLEVWRGRGEGARRHKLQLSRSKGRLRK